MMVTARNAEIDRVVAFELGVDDYITKPFSMRELLLRVRAILRRQVVPQASEEGIIDFGALRIDRAAHRVWVCGKEVELTLLEFKLLLTLFERRNRVQTRLALLDDVWGIDSKISPRSVDAHVKRLRERLGKARDYIETVRGVGYRFVDEPVDCPCLPQE
jgi:two-component system phosphate regulon response regulator PhoB